MAKIRVLLADDHPVVRTGLRTLLERASDIVVVAEAETGAEVLALVEEASPDVLVLDMEMPDLSGVEVAKQLRSANASVRILVLSAHADRYYMKEVLSNGAYGYLVKDEAPRLIIDAVRGAALGQTGWMSRSAAAEMSTMVFKDDASPHSITEREQQVMRLIAQGRTNQEIGRELGISEKTVEKHVSALLEKLNVSSRTQVAVHAVRSGMA